MNGITELKVDGKPVKVQFSILSFRYFCEDRNIGLSDLGKALQSNDVFAIADMIYFAAKAYADLNKKDFDYSKQDATEWISEITEEQLNDIINTMMDVKLFGKKLNEHGAKTAKSNKKK